jgi:hypothetical protein
LKNRFYSVATPIATVGLVVGGLMLLAGVPVLEVVLVVAILLVQMAAGVMIWGFIDPQSSKSIPLLIGAGSTVGFTTSTLSHQLLRTTPLSGIAWLLPLIGVLVFVFFKRKQNDFEATSEVEFDLKTFVPILVLFTTIGLGDQWWWIYPIVFLSGALVIANFLHKDIYKVVFLLTPFALLFSVVLRKMNYLWWIITNDIPYLESLAYSVNRWGPRKNISAVGTELSYHWFALAWSGMTTQLSGAQSWTVLTIMLPIVVCMTIGLLVWGIIYETTTSSILATIGAASVLLLRDVVSVTSPTHMFSFTIMFVLVLMMKRWLETHTITLQAAITASLLLFCLFGSKVSTGATFMAGAGLTILFNNHTTKLTRIKILTASVITAAASYTYFFGNKPRSPQNSLHIRFNDIGGLLIVDRPLGGGLFHLPLEMFTFALFVLPMLGPVLLLLWLSKKFRTDAFHLFLSLAIISGLILGRFLDGSGTESYFLHVTMPLSLLLIALLLKNLHTLTTHVISFQVFAALSIGGLVLGYLRNMGSGIIKSQGNYSVVWRSAPYLVVCVIVLITPAIFNLISPKNKRLGIQTVATAICLLLSTSMVGSQINHRVNFARLAISVSSNSEPQFVKWNHLSGSPDQIAAISWIRSNTKVDEIIATNRRCQQISFCGTPKWKLLSAISHRQILLEGNSTGLPNETPWVDERKILSEEFIVAPNKQMANRLYELGVRWHYVELPYIETPSGWEPLELAQQRTWEPWAEVVYRNNTVVVLKLQPPTP